MIVFKALATLKPQAGIAVTPTTPTPAVSMPVSNLQSLSILAYVV